MESRLDDGYLGTRGLIAPSQCMFIQRWTELLNPRTIDTYRARYLNTHGALVELKEITELILDENIGESNFNPVKDECLQLVKSDKTLTSHARSLVGCLCRNISLGKPGSRASLNRIIYQVKHSLLIISPNYLNWILADLNDAFVRDDVELVNALTSSLVTELLSIGWSRRRLYELRLLFLREGPFIEKWMEFSDSISCRRKTYKCYLPIDAAISEKIIAILRNNGISIVSGERLCEDYREHSTAISRNKLYLLYQIESFDKYAVMDKAKTLFSANMDVLGYYRILGNCHPKAAVIVDIATNTPEAIEDERWMELDPPSEPQALRRFLNFSTSTDYDSISKERFKSSFSHYRMAISSLSLEAKFLNLWVAFESFCRSPRHDSIIECIKCVVPEVLCQRYLYRLIRNYIEDCFRVRPDFFGAILNAEDKGETKVRKLILAQREPAYVDHIQRQADCHTLLSFRTRIILGIMSNPKKSAELLRNHRRTLEWHIQRLYRIRNMIVHTGRVEATLGPLLANIDDYVRRLISECANVMIKWEISDLDAALERIIDNFHALVAVLDETTQIDPDHLLVGVIN